MCGRYDLHTLIGTLAVLFEFKNSIPEVKPRYNIAPSQTVLAVRKKENEEEREGVLFRWGLVPHWAKDQSVGYKMINARSETVTEKPSFREAFKKRRCIILADGYFEWKHEGKTKRPFRFHRKDEKPMAFAGLWERWEKGPEPIESCTILTTEGNELSKDIHDRMPVILTPKGIKQWLGEALAEKEALQSLLIPFPSNELVSDKSTT